MPPHLIEKTLSAHRKRFSAAPKIVSYAPGRVEILGNHTDYNEGFVLSAAIDSGICAAVSESGGKNCVLSALDFNEETKFALPVTAPAENPSWANYIRGVINKLDATKNKNEPSCGFNMTFGGDVPLGAGLSSSAALEVATALALISFNGLKLPNLQIARLCQQAENEFTGAKCGLLDQISSLFGAEHALVFTDFRTLAVETLPLAPDICFLLANTRVKHNLVESDYNERRAACENAAIFFASALKHPVPALRDVSMEELNKHAKDMDPVIAGRAKHIIGENERVIRAKQLLADGKLKEFGKLMFASHESSRFNFENSCPELDFIVDTAQGQNEVLGARLSGGGFGGSVVLLIHPRDAEKVGEKISSAYAARFGSACDIRIIKPSNGARLLNRAS